MKWSARALCVALGVPVLAACYSYTVVPVERVSVGTAVRARITGTEADQLGQQLGREQDRTLEGELIERGGDGGLLVSVPSTVGQGDGSVGTLYQRVALPRDAVVELEVRRLQPWKTGGIIAAAAAVLGYVAIHGFGNQNATPGPGKGGTNK